MVLSYLKQERRQIVHNLRKRIGDFLFLLGIRYLFFLARFFDALTPKIVGTIWVLCGLFVLANLLAEGVFHMISWQVILFNIALAVTAIGVILLSQPTKDDL